MTFFDALLHLGEREEEELVVGEVGEAGQRAPVPGSLPRPEAGEGAEGGLQAPVVRDVLPESLHHYHHDYHHHLHAVDVLPGLSGQVAVLGLQTLGTLLQTSVSLSSSLVSLSIIMNDHNHNHHELSLSYLVGQQRVIAPPVPHVACPVILTTLTSHEF